MGASWRKYQDHFEPDPTVLGGDSYTLQLLQHLHFSLDDVDSLYTAFRDMDADNCGVIHLDELLLYFNIKKTELTEKIFEDKESKYPFFLNFEQFVIFTWQFLSLRLEKVATFAFHLMDKKKTGFLSQDSIKYLIELMHNKMYEESKAVQKLVKQCGAFKNGEKLSRTEFEEFSARHRLLCDPFRRVQISYQSKLLGRVIWKRIRQEREEHLVVDGGSQEVHDDPGVTLLAKFRKERRLNTSLVEFEKRVTAQEAMLQEMMGESVPRGGGETPFSKNVSKREIQLQTEDLSSDRIILPVEGKIRPPRSASLHRKPRLIPNTEPPKKKKKKKKKSFGVRRFINKSTSYSENDPRNGGHVRRRSMDDSSRPNAMLKDINNVEIFKSASLDVYDDEDDQPSKDPTEVITETFNSPKSNDNRKQFSKKGSFKDCTVIPF